MRRILPALLALLLLLPACGRGEGTPEGEYRLYFLTGADSGPALAAEPWSPAEEGAEVGPEELLEALLAGPVSEDLSSPFPRGTTLRSLSQDPENEGNLLIYLSEQYGGLTDVSLTLADYAIALTLGQLEGVESVEITAAGRPAGYRSHQLLVPDEAVLDELPAGGGAEASSGPPAGGTP